MGVASGGLGYFFRDMDRNGSIAAPRPLTTTAAPVQPLPPETQPILQPGPAPTQQSEPSELSKTEPAVTTQPVPETQAAPDERPTGGEVTISGDARTVILKGGGETHLVPGAVPAGDYEIFADFGDGVVSAGRATVRAGKVIDLGCENFFFQCRPK